LSTETDAANAWVVNFFSGNALIFDKIYFHLVRAVRGGP
jgi:hypothetical protein